MFAALFNKFMVSLSMAILEKAMVKGSLEFKKYMEFKDAMAEAKKYSDAVKKGGSREERRRAEDDFLG